ncbi:ATP-binding protein [Desertivirga xinjiangensis]|uniref:ATP-binding protein n=1 Tax=Desertivirga xinjiangensis TaxID=539206 RepID=UPI00210A3030|nr:AAA family ATPase [Pedobacter xinjiangensis]
MEKLFQYQATLLQKVNNQFNRYLFHQVQWQERFVGVKGLRGVGKTTLLLQHLKYNLKDTSKNLYVTLDHPWFYNNNLYDLAQQFHQLGGRTLLVDEVHKMKDWSRQIKIIYDGLPDLQVIFTSSSALDLYRGEADLSRRVSSYELAGLSFREYLSFFHNINYLPISLTDLLENHLEHAAQLTGLFKPLSLFTDYLKKGYFPFSKGLNQESFETRLVQTMEVTLSEDLAYIAGYTAEHIFKIKKLLGILAESVPFTANISAIAEKLGIGRNTIKEYLHALEKAGLLHFLNRDGKGISLLQKPDKIYLANTNFSYALKTSPDVGTLRETFILNQLTNYRAEAYLPAEGDISVRENEKLFTFEVGGKKKSAKQIQNVPNSFVIADDIETGFMNKIPIYLFGFLY